MRQYWFVSTHSAICPIRIGRQSEISTLELNATSRRMTLICGPAGIGKSRLSVEALRLAEHLGYSALVGYCSQEQVLPYAPFVSAIRRRTRTMGSSELRSLFDGPAALAAALVPEIGLNVGLSVGSPSQEELFAAVWQLLHRLAGTVGCVLLLEDLHWADADTLRLLGYLARESEGFGVWIIGTYRDDEIHRRHPFAAVLADLSRERRADEIVLASLSREELTSMISAIFDGAEIGDEFVDAMYSRTGGNPFFVEELLKVLIERGDLYLDAGDWARRDLAEIEMPLTVRESLLARARNLSSRALEMLHIAALASDDLDVNVLAAAIGLAPYVVEEDISECLNLQLVAERRGAAQRSYVFRHALTREALSDEVIGPDRRRGHLRIAEAIVKMHEDQLDAFAAQLADHFLAGGDAARAVEFARRAAEVAASSFAVNEAGRRYEQTLSLMAPDAPERIEVLLDAVAATIEAPDRRLGVAFASEAQRLAHDNGDRVAEARALSALATDASQDGRTPEAVAILRRAVITIEGVDDFHEATILAALCRQLTRSDQIEEATALLPGAIEIAERSLNHRALSFLHVTSMMNSSFGPTFEVALDSATKAARVASDQRAEYGVLQTAGYICVWCGDFARAQRSFLDAIALRERIAPHDRYTEAGYTWLLSLTGEYEAARLQSVEPRTDGSVPTRIVALTGLIEVAERTGEVGVSDLIDELWTLSMRTGESQRSVPALSARARKVLAEVDADVAGPMFWEVLERTTTARRRGSHWMFSPDFARGLLTSERSNELERWSSAIAAMTANDAHPHNRAAALLVRAYLATSQGATGAARESFELSRTMYTAMPCPAREIEALLGLAELERRSGQDEASQLAARGAVELAERFGANVLAATAREALERASPPSVLATILFTDIVSSTEQLSQIGDRAWRSVLERHDAVVRHELERFGGREVNTTGDGFVAAFDSPTQGIRCALALRDSLETLGVRIRAGMHTGECQLLGSNLSGIAVHIAARVCAEARSSELLVTSTVRDLVVGAGLTFGGRGDFELKGVPGVWHLFSI